MKGRYRDRSSEPSIRSAIGHEQLQVSRYKRAPAEGKQQNLRSGFLLHFYFYITYIPFLLYYGSWLNRLLLNLSRLARNFLLQYCLSIRFDFISEFKSIDNIRLRPAIFKPNYHVAVKAESS